MRLTRVHVEASLAVGRVLDLPETAAAHLVRVLRLHEGDACVLFNGDGHDYAARLCGVGKRAVQVQVESAARVDNESPLAVTLLQGIARGEKMDLILQKATELGVARIRPVYSERSEVRLDATRADKRLAHWRGVVASACGQSGRARVPPVDPPLPLAQAARDAVGTCRYLSPQAVSGIDVLAAPADASITLAIGPEGGFAARDLQVLDEAGFHGLRLGPRILRTETAGLAAIAALQMRFGDLR